VPFLNIQRAKAVSPVIGVDHPANPGEVMLFKEANLVDDRINVWEVTLRVEGKDSPKTSDIVLVIDTSNSMGDYGRIQSAKNAANQFIDTLLPSNVTRIGIVSFDDNGYLNSTLTNDTAALKAAVNDLSVKGGTFTQVGVKSAENMLAKSTADSKHIVLLSDGVPTYSYMIPNVNTRRAGYVYDSSNNLETGTGYSSDAYDNVNYYRVGNGQGYRTYIETYYYGGYYRYAYYNHSNSAIAEAGFAKTAGNRLWTIALDVSPMGQQVLNTMASPDSYFTATPSELETIFTGIAGQIGSAVSDSTATDPMGQGFSIPLVDVTNITTVPTDSPATYDPVTNKMNWNPGTLTTPIASGSDIKYAELKYIIEITDDILNQIPTGDLYLTNGDANLTYTDHNGNIVKKPFPVPSVDPVIISIEKVLYDSSGYKITTDPLDRIFTIEVKATDPSLYHKTFDLRIGEKRVLTNLSSLHNYVVEETQVRMGNTGTPESVSDNYYSIIDGVPGNTFNVAQTSPDFPIVVKNTEKALGKLIVGKVFKPLGPDSNVGSATGGVGPDFTFTVTGPNGYSNTFTLKAGESRVFENLNYGEYTVTETNSQGFQVSYSDTDATNGNF